MVDDSGADFGGLWGEVVSRVFSRRLRWLTGTPSAKRPHIVVLRVLYGYIYRDGGDGCTRIRLTTLGSSLGPIRHLSSCDTRPRDADAMQHAQKPYQQVVVNFP